LVLTKAVKQWHSVVSKTSFYFRTTEEMETLKCLTNEKVVMKYKDVTLRASCTIKVANTQQGKIRHF